MPHCARVITPQERQRRNVGGIGCPPCDHDVCPGLERSLNLFDPGQCDDIGAVFDDFGVNVRSSGEGSNSPVDQRPFDVVIRLA